MDLDKEELKATRKLNGVDKKSNIEEDINLINLKEISERFSNGTETIEDIINYCRNYEIKFENGLKLRVVEKRYFDKLVERIKELEEENKKNVERYEERDNEVWERVKQCKNMQTEIDGLYLDKEELEQAYLHEKLAKEEVEELLEDSIPKQKVKEIIYTIIDYKIPRATNNGYYYDYFIKQEYKNDFVKLFNKLLEDK